MKRDGMTLMEYRAHLEEKRAKAAEKGKALGLRKPRKRRIDRRKTAFARLKALCKLYVMTRARKRTGGDCEVGVVCGGIETASLPYHIFPAATGNAIKYDVRNLLGGCYRCNGGEYFDRKRGTYERWDRRHKSILGEQLWAELKAAAGRKKITTVEAEEMAAAIKTKIEQGDLQ